MGTTAPSILNSLQFPRATFTAAYDDERQQKLPQCIAHRGDATTQPENTLAAFEAAVRVGAHAVEMDVLATKDGVVVISHDPTLQSQFGRPQRIAESNWSDLQNLKTLRPPHEHMPRLEDVLDWLLQPGKESIWVMLEVKTGGDTARTMRLTEAVIRANRPPAHAKPWNERIVVCVLPVSYLVLAAKYLPGFPVAHIGFSRSYIRQLFAAPNISFNIASSLLILPGWRGLLNEAQQKHRRPVYAWVVNEEETMQWCIRRRIDGVLCDDPKKFLSICKHFNATAREPWFALSLATYWKALTELWSMARLAWKRRKMLELPANPTAP